jgi:hypothetical protein
MYILNIYPSITSSITVDNTSINIDTTYITVDSENSASIVYTLKVIPREYKEEVVVNLYNELTSVNTIINCNTLNENNFMYVYINYEFQNDDLFETTITDVSGSLLWRGKVGATSQTDIQNYKLNVPDNNNIIKI